MVEISIDLETLLNLSTISKKNQKHLAKVYSLLGVNVLSSILGFYVSRAFNVSSIFSDGVFSIFMLAFFFISIAGIFKITIFNNIRKGLFLVLPFLIGGNFNLKIAGISPNPKVQEELISLAISSVIIASAIFFMFSLLAYLTSSRVAIFTFSFLFALLAPLLLTIIYGVLGLFVKDIRFPNFFYGILMGWAYVTVDTQMMLKRFEVVSENELDVFQDAMNLFLDFVQIFSTVFNNGLSQKDKDEQKEKKD